MVYRTTLQQELSEKKYILPGSSAHLKTVCAVGNQES